VGYSANVGRALARCSLIGQYKQEERAHPVAIFIWATVLTLNEVI